MDPAVDPFHPFLRRLERYRHGVHRLGDPAGEPLLERTAQRLGRPLPMAWRAFAARWNGADLFRGALRLRAADELAALSEAWPQVVIFAEGPQGRRWCWAPHGSGHVFGAWEGGALRPLHDRFDRWLLATVRILDEEVAEADELEVRLEQDPEGGWLLLAEAEALLARGDPQAAARRLVRATTADPGLIPAWQRLGEILLDTDRAEARFALLRALRASRMPAPWPGARRIEPAALGRLAGLFPPGDPAWREELRRTLAEGVLDARTDEDLALFERLALELARACLAVRERREAAEALGEAARMAKGFSLHRPLTEVLLLRARLLADLGRFDEAEQALQPLRLGGDPAARGRALLEVGRIAVQRQEPWAEDILEEALADLHRPADRARAWLLLAERHVQAGDAAAAASALEEADRMAVAAGSDELRAAVGRVAGDLARLQGDAARAREAWERAAGLLPPPEASEEAARVLLRLAEADLAEGRSDEGVAALRRAAGAFGGLELPVREAWALLRLASHGGGASLLDEARRRFEAAELAAGMVAVDAMAGQVGRSLDWHLSCCAGHARSRVDVLRGRLPGGREAAERPERRIGGHRSALLHGGRELVSRLAAELRRLARALQGGPSTGLDPATARFVATADLLSGFRSAEAARALVHHLLEPDLPTAARLAVQGAVARSVNPAVPHALLEALDQELPGSRLVPVVEVLGWRQESTAVEPLMARLEQAAHPHLRRALVVALGRIGDRRAVDTLVELLDERSLDEALAVALLLLGDRRGVDFHGQALAQGLELDRSPGEIVGRYGGPDYLLLLLHSAEGTGPRAAGALQGLGYLGDSRAAPVMLRALSRPEGGIDQVAASALELLTGHREPEEGPAMREGWASWWESNAERFPPGVRYRYGRVLSVDLLVELLDHPDSTVRHGVYDELVIGTGVRLPFDADGPWRIQRRHLAAWRRWSRSAEAARLTPGRWWFDGRIVG